MSVKFAQGTALNPGKPVRLFQDKRTWSGYDVAADGRFVVAVETDDKATSSQLNVILHWFEELKQSQPK
jgi:hypothetical protein